VTPPTWHPHCRWSSPEFWVESAIIAAFAIGFVVLATWPLWGATRSGEIHGTIDRIYDGDTFWICDSEKCTKIRTCGIDAPEKKEPMSRKSEAALKVLVAGKKVICIEVGHGTVCDGRSRSASRDRVVAQCSIGGVDMGAWMVKHGYACDWVRYSGGAYSKNEPALRCRK